MIPATMPRFSFDPVKHYYTLDGAPLVGTTTALGIMDKPGLTWWASGMCAAEFGWLNPKKATVEECIEAARKGFANIFSMTGNLDTYIKFLNQAYRAHSQKKKDTAETGKDMHSMLEDFTRCRIEGRDPLIIEPLIQPFVDWANKNVNRFLFTELCCYSQVLHVGGTADFGYEDMAGNMVLGDFKSSETAYYAHYLQCGAYDLQISENGGYTQDGQKVFTLEKPFERYEIFCFRAGLDKPFLTRECNRLRRAFSYAVNLYREKMFWEDAIDSKESGIKSYGGKR